MAYNPDMPSPAAPRHAVSPALAAEIGATHAEVLASRARIIAKHPELEDALHKGYEPHDIGLRGVFIFLITLVITMVVVLAAMWGVMMMFVKYDRSNDPIASPVKMENTENAVPLQPSPPHDYNDREDMTRMRLETSAALQGGAASTSGRHSIPIDEAMKQVRLDVRPAVPPSAPQSSPPVAPEHSQPTHGEGAAH